MTIVKYGKQDECGRIGFNDVEIAIFSKRTDAEKFICEVAKEFVGNVTSVEELAEKLIEMENGQQPTMYFEII